LLQISIFLLVILFYFVFICCFVLPYVYLSFFSFFFLFSHFVLLLSFSFFLVFVLYFSFFYVSVCTFPIFFPFQLRVEPGNIRLPADLIEAAGAPFNTLRPGGDLRMSWDTLSAHFGAAQGLDGTLTLDWSDARSALSPVAPLGSYRLTAHGAGAQIGFELATIKGPLLLSGNGQWTPQHLQFRGEAQAEPAVRTELGPLIGLLGRPSANGAELRFGS